MNKQEVNKCPFSFKEILKRSEMPVPEVKYFNSFDKTKLAYYDFFPKGRAVSSIVILHGGGAHSLAGGYEVGADTLRKRYNIRTYLVDLRGHGKSEGIRGDSPKVEHVWKDLSLIIDFVKSENKDIPLYLCGHSSGAGLILNYINFENKESVKGYFFISPEFGYRSGCCNKKLKYPFAEIRLPVFIISGMTNGLLLGNTKAVMFNYPDDILNKDKLIINYITRNMAAAMTPNNPKKQFKAINKPYGLFIGENDELFDAEKVSKYNNFPDVNIRKKSECKIIKNANHLSILLSFGEEVGKTILKWQKV